MNAPRMLIATAMVLVWTAAARSTLIAGPQKPGELPAGEGRDTVVTICGDCHDAQQMANSRRTRVEWQTLIEDMAARNNVASDEEKKIVLGYALRNFGKVNINSATADDIVAIVELPAAQATAIVDYRQKSGEFKTLDDLRQVPGIDFAKLQERKDRIGFTGP
jgi:competence protein ComEA